MTLGYVPTDWNYSDALTKEEFGEIFAQIRRDPYFWEDRPAYEDNVKALREFFITQQNQEIYYVTSRVSTSGRPVSIQTEEWLIANHIWPEDNYHAIIPVSEPGLKKFVMADLGIDLSIDDYGPTVRECKDVKNHKAYLLDRSWNREEDYGTRIFNLEQFLNLAAGRKEYYLV